MNYAYLRFPDFKGKAVTLSYDDGMMFDERMIAILDKYGLKCTFNLNSGQFAEKPYEEDYLHGRLTKEQCVALYKNSPHEIAVHGYKHLSLIAYDDAGVMNDILFDRKNLEQIFGRVVKGMAYAYGDFNDEVVEDLRRCGISYSRTTKNTHAFDLPKDWLRMPATCHHNDPKLPELVEKFSKLDVGDGGSWDWFRKEPQWFCLWGHSSEFFRDKNWDVLENFGKELGGRDDIWNVTTGELYEYVQAYNRLQWSVDGKFIHNPSATDVYLLINTKKYVAKAGETLAI